MKYFLIVVLCFNICAAEDIKEPNVSVFYKKCAHDMFAGKLNGKIFDVIELTNVICQKFIKLDQERNDLLDFLNGADPASVISDELKKIPVPALISAEDLDNEQKNMAVVGIEMAHNRLYSIKKIHEMFASYINFVVNDLNQNFSLDISENVSDFLTSAQILIGSSK